MNTFQHAKRIVVKIGTSTLTHSTGMVHLRRVEQLVKILSDLKNAGKELILVSSGSIAVGVGKLGLPCRPTDIPSKQACAAVGQCELMYLYDKMFGEHNHVVAQVLLTRDVVEASFRVEHARNTFQRLLEMGSVPIVNENDTVAVEEIEFGDNDTLSAIVASIAEADALVILSDIDGLYTSNPRTNEEAKLISYVEEVNDELEQIASGAGTSRGTGGMITKLHAAKIAARHGVPMAIINGTKPTQLYDLFDGKQVGTYFAAKERREDFVWR